MNAKIILLVAGLVVGALAGWFLTPGRTVAAVGVIPLNDPFGIGQITPVAEPETDYTWYLKVLASAMVFGAGGVMFGYLVDRERRHHHSA